jgi:hypothetical protein
MTPDVKLDVIEEPSTLAVANMLALTDADPAEAAFARP